MHSVCIFGANGYIGSALSAHLKDANDISITKISSVAESDACDSDFLNRFDTIVYLAGATTGTGHQDFTRNVDDIKKIADRLTARHLLIYASSAIVYDGIAGECDEDVVLPAADSVTYASSMRQRECLIRSYSSAFTSVALRFGSVVGYSRNHSQRISQMFSDAVLVGRVEVSNAFTRRAVLPMCFAAHVMTALVRRQTLRSLSQHEILNVAAYNTTIGALAESICVKTGAKAAYTQTRNDDGASGFSLDTKRLLSTVACDAAAAHWNNDKLVDQVLQSATSQILSSRETNVAGQVCFCCDGTDMFTLLDLGNQPLANDFCRDAASALQSQRYPLKMVRCRSCTHSQLTCVVPPDQLFKEYIYLTGTSNTIRHYCDEFCSHAMTRVSKVGTVLDIACNDGTQLNSFKAAGWATFGVDPAANIVPLALAQGHSVVCGFWGDDDVLETLRARSATFDVIVAQNVFAHVPAPKRFLEHCCSVMRNDSLLFIQTSQADIFQTGEFDTMYHEHLSFFTVASMSRLVQRCGLVLSDVRKVHVHGTSYVFELRKFDSSLGGDFEQPESVRAAIAAEKYIYEERYAVFYKRCAEKKSDTVAELLRSFGDSALLVGFGACAKGNTLLNKIAADHIDNKLLDFIVDENPLKQQLFAPGTGIPVLPLDALRERTESNVVVIVLAWNYLDEAKQKIAAARKESSKKTIVIVPFPTPTSWILGNEGVSYTLTGQTVLEPLVSLLSDEESVPMQQKRRAKTVLITHFYNEELMLPYWIRHHAPMFDEALLIDYASTDRSAQLIAQLAPSSWRVVQSRNAFFDAFAVDVEVRDYEQQYPVGTYKMAITITEFVVWPTLRADLDRTLLLQDANNADQPTTTSRCLALLLYGVCGDDEANGNTLFSGLPLPQQRSQIFPTPGNFNCRFIHSYGSEFNYYAGRHGVTVPADAVPNAFIMKFQFSPWPQSKQRKLQIGARQPQSDINGGYGFQHQWNEAQLDQIRGEFMSHCICRDLLRDNIASPVALRLSDLLCQQLAIPWRTTF